MQWMDLWKKIAEEELQTMLYTSLADQVQMKQWIHTVHIVVSKVEHTYDFILN